jgi:hypothetical protein
LGKVITEVVDVIRSKNAGPYELTFDIIFKELKDYDRIKKSGIINSELISKLYQIPIKNVTSIINFDPAKAIKITIIRPISAGAPGERDVYGAQQHAPLMTIEI